MKLILIVGPSGSGKDTLLRAARRHFADRLGLVFTRRYITRPPGEYEDNYYLSREGFTALDQAGFFAVTWHSHGFLYGIARCDFQPMPQKRAVIASVSRSVISRIEAQAGEVHTVLIEAKPEVLRARLRNRGRESEEAIATRLERTYLRVKARNLIRFDNSDELTLSQALFIGLLEHLADQEATV